MAAETIGRESGKPGAGQDPGPAGLRTIIQAELGFFQDAVKRARAWRKAWRNSAAAAREALISEQARLLAEILARDESLRRIHASWGLCSRELANRERAGIRSAARRLDRTMRSLLAIEKENLEAAEGMRRDVLRDLGEVRSARRVLSVYRGPDDPVGPHCVDRKL